LLGGGGSDKGARGGKKKHISIEKKKTREILGGEGKIAEQRGIKIHSTRVAAEN